MITQKYIAVTASMLLFAALQYPCLSQNIEEIKKDFPGEQAVIWNQSEHYKIKIKDGQPYAESKETEELLFLSPMQPPT
ncbi:MAG: hypothetical protein WDN26_23575 [Chitinophagaceae bacterium]